MTPSAPYLDGPTTPAPQSDPPKIKSRSTEARATRVCYCRVNVAEGSASRWLQCTPAGFHFDSLVPRTPTVLIWVDDFPGRAICQLTLNVDHVEKRVFFAD
jgi:hypothetical protein